MKNKVNDNPAKRFFYNIAPIIIFLLFPYYLLGLDPARSTLKDHWQKARGLPSDTILTLNQTADGYLWIGTPNGLVKFDGIKFSPMVFSGEQDMSRLETRCLFVDKESTLWIGSAGGLATFQYRTGKSKIFTGADGITVDGIRCIKEDMQGNTWIGFTTSYVNCFSKGEFVAFEASSGLLGKKVNSIVEDDQGNLLFATRENGIFIFRDGKFASYPVAGLGNVTIVTIYVDSRGILWIGTMRSGLYRVTGQEIEQYTLNSGLTANFITSIMEDSDRNLWVGTLAGLNRIQIKEDGTPVIENVLTSHIINCLFEDSEKSLWVGTDASGLIRLKEGKFSSPAMLASLPDEKPLCLYEDADGDTWIGTHSGTLIRCRDGKINEIQSPPILSGKGITAIAHDRSGNLWLGTLTDGLYRKKKERNDAFDCYTTYDNLADNVVNSIFLDSRDNLWFSTFAGLSRLRSLSTSTANTFDSLRRQDGVAGTVVFNIIEDSAGNTWVAADRGITVLEKGDFEKKINYLPDIPVTCVYEDVDSPAVGGSVYWIATAGGGLKRFRYGEFFSFTTAQGMDSDYLYQFFDDRQGNFWIMSDNGILRVNKNELKRCADGLIDRINCTSFGISDGLPSLEFDNKFSRGSALKTAKGELWFITKKGIATVNPAAIRANKLPPPVVIESLYADNRPIPISLDGGPYAFKGVRDLVFCFTALTYLSPDKVKFEYCLEEFDQQRKLLLPGKERLARYRDLAPGTYTFKVIACNAEGIWNPTGTSLVFTLEAVFYRTIWFKTAVALFFLLSVFAGFYLYKKASFKKRTKYKSSSLNPVFAEECIGKLKQLMENEKLYLRTDLSLQSLAGELNISPHILSQILNERLLKNFPDFVNSYRIEEAKRILRSPGGELQKIDAIALDVGFNTKVAFYKAFKKNTGKTPTEYKKEEK